MLVRCLYPRTVYNRYTHELISVPCGHCDYCRSIKSLAWSNRLELECKQHRYTIFGTLTYSDEHLPRLAVSDIVSDTISDSIDKSIDFIQYHDGFVPVCLTKDFQDFMKRLRINLQRKYGIKKPLLRYFTAFEYGPTTFRPHMHYLLWFDDELIAQNIKECIYTSWKPKNSCPFRRTWFKRNQTKFVIGYSCARYVAGYLNSLASVPPILLEKPFKPRHLQSINPCIGFGNLSKELVFDFITGRLDKVDFVRPSNNRIISLPLWRSFEMRWLPKCIGFDKITSSDRESLYTVYSSSRFGKDYYTFEFWVLREWFSTCFLSTILRAVIPSENCCSDGRLFNLAVLRRIWETSRIFVGNAKAFDLSSSEYLAYIEKYYVRKDYVSLCSQLRTEIEWLSACPREDFSSVYLPFLIDSQFYENLRSLPCSTRQLYLDQFNSTDKFFELPFFTTDWRNKRAFYHRLVEENTKTRRKKDYVSEHPEFSKFYINLSNLL